MARASPRPVSQTCYWHSVAQLWPMHICDVSQVWYPAVANSVGHACFAQLSNSVWDFALAQA